MVDDCEPFCYSYGWGCIVPERIENRPHELVKPEGHEAPSAPKHMPAPPHDEFKKDTPKLDAVTNVEPAKAAPRPEGAVLPREELAAKKVADEVAVRREPSEEHVALKPEETREVLGDKQKTQVRSIRQKVERVEKKLGSLIGDTVSSGITLDIQGDKVSLDESTFTAAQREEARGIQTILRNWQSDIKFDEKALEQKTEELKKKDIEKSKDDAQRKLRERAAEFLSIQNELKGIARQLRALEGNPKKASS
jgi:hypothetical protein